MSKNIKNVFSFIVSLVLMVVIILGGTTVFFNTTVLNENKYINSLEKNDIYAKIKTNIDNNLKYLMLSSNLDENILNNVISEDEIKDIVDGYVNYFVSYMKREATEIPKLDTSVYYDRIDASLDKYLRENHVTYLNEDVKKDMEEIKNIALQIISSDLNIIDFNALSKSTALRAVASVSSVINNIAVVGMIGLVVLMLIGIIFLIWSKSRAVRAYAWTGYSFISAGMIMTLIGVSGLISKFYNNIALNIDYLVDGITGIIKVYLTQFSIIGSVITIVGFVVLSRYWVHLYRKYTRSRKS